MHISLVSYLSPYIVDLCLCIVVSSYLSPHTCRCVIVFVSTHWRPVFGSCKCVVVFVSTHWRPAFGSCKCVVVFVSTHWQPAFGSCKCVIVFVSTHWQPAFGSCKCVVVCCCCCLRPCFLQVFSTVFHVLLLLSLTMLRAGLVNSMSCVFDHALCWSC